MEKELVSIVIPVYNAEKYIEECLYSVLNQSYKNIEVIIVNDGSTDSSGSICKKYEREYDNIRYIEKNNEGLSVARRTGIAAVNGKYFSTIDSDDVLEIDYIMKLHESLVENQSDIALCGRIAFDHNGCLELPIKKELMTCKKIEKEDIEKDFWVTALDYQMSDSWNKMYRTDFVRNSGVVHELNRKYNGTDLLFNHLLLLHGPVISTVHELLYKYRIVEGSIVHRKDKSLQEGFEVITTRLLQECISLDYSEKALNQIILTYYGTLKYVTTDIVEYYTDHEREKKLKGCIRKHCEFVKEIGRDVNMSSILATKPISLRIFFILLKSGSYRGISFYYKIRDKRNMAHEG